MVMFAVGEKFLAKHLGGRFQETMTPEVSARLKQITIDPKTVVMAKKADMNSAPTASAAGKWNLTADAGGQTIPIVLELKQDGSAVTGSLSSPMGGGAVKSGKVSGNSFTGIASVEVQGQQMEITLEGTIDGEKMTGTITGPGLPSITFTAIKEK
jgi:hypothetical protein